MAGRLDPSVENLEAFIGVLTAAVAGVHETQPGLVAHGEALEELHQDAGEDVDGLDHDLDEALPALDTLADDTKDELEKLGSTAKAGDDGTLTDAKDAFEEWEETLGGTLDAAASRVGDEAAELETRGFDELAQTLAASVAAIDASQAATEAAFEALHAALKHEGDLFTGALTTATLEAQEAAEQAGALESAFQTKADAAIEAIKTSSGAAVAVHGETGSGAGTFYDGIEGRAQSETQDLVAAVKDAFETSAESIREASENPLLEPVDSVMTDALDPFSDEAVSWSGQEQATTQGLSTWDTLLKDLAASIEVMQQIQALGKVLE